MTPILVVDNSNRVVCRGHVATGPGQASAHLTFTDAAWPTEEQQARAARTVADITVMVRRRLEEAERRIATEARRRNRRQLVARALVVARVVSLWAVGLTVSWALVLGAAWLVARAIAS